MTGFALPELVGAGVVVFLLPLLLVATFFVCSVFCCSWVAMASLSGRSLARVSQQAFDNELRHALCTLEVEAGSLGIYGIRVMPEV